MFSRLVSRLPAPADRPRLPHAAQCLHQRDALRHCSHLLKTTGTHCSIMTVLLKLYPLTKLEANISLSLQQPLHSGYNSVVQLDFGRVLLGKGHRHWPRLPLRTESSQSSVHQSKTISRMQVDNRKRFYSSPL
jgi:hypothetical protein